jgi:hypothetical protein
MSATFALRVQLPLADFALDVTLESSARRLGRLCLQFGAKYITGQADGRSESGHLASPAPGHIISTRGSRLPRAPGLYLGKRCIQMHGGDTVLIVKRQILESGDLPTEITSGGVGEPAPEVASGVTKTLRESDGATIQKNARSLTGTRT